MAYYSEQYCGPVYLDNINDERNTPHSKLLHLCETYSGTTLAKDIKRFIGSLKMTNVAINNQRQNALHVTCANYKGRDLFEAVTVLLEAGIPVNSADAALRNALHHLMFRDNLQQVGLNETVKLLIDRIKIDSIQCRDIDCGRSALHLLCSRPRNDTPLQLVRTLLNNGVNVNFMDNELRTALHVLCENTEMCNRTDIAEAMIAFGFELNLVNAETVWGNNALHSLFQLKITGINYMMSTKTMALFLIKLGINANRPNKDGMYPLHLLCQNYKGDDLLEIITSLAEHQVDMNCKTKDGKTALHLVLQYYTHSNSRLIDVVDYLISFKVDSLAESLKEFAPVYKKSLLATNRKEQNALHLTCANYQGPDLLEVVRFLIVDVGIAVNSVDFTNRNALHHLMRRENVQQLDKVVELLIEREIDINCLDICGRSALHLLCSRPRNDTPLQLVRTLLNNGGVNVNLLDNELRTALHVLCENTAMCNRTDIAEAMIAFALFGLDLVNAETVWGNNALHSLFQLKITGINYMLSTKTMALFLIKRGINVNRPNKDGMYPLHLLCQNYKGDDLLDIVAALAKHQVDINCKTKDGENALHLVLQYYTHSNSRLIDVVDYLISLKVDSSCLDCFREIPLNYYSYKRHEVLLNPSVMKKLVERMIGKYEASSFGARSLIVGLDASVKTDSKTSHQRDSDANTDELLDLCQKYNGFSLAEFLKEFAPVDKTSCVIATNQKGQNALHVTCANYQGQDLLEVVRFLIVDVGIAVNSVDCGGRNALHLLMLRDNVQQLNQVVDILIEKGIDIHRTDKIGNSALHLLCSRQDKDTPIDLVLLLLENKLDVHLLDFKCETALHDLCRNSHMCHRVDIAEAVIAFGTDSLLNAESMFGNNALHFLLELTGKPSTKEMALFLIENGINVDMPNKAGMYPLHLLCKNYKGDDFLDIVAILAGHQVDVNCKTKQGKNALHLVFEHYDTNNGQQLKDVVDDLIAWGVDATVTDEFGILPISYLYDRDPKCMPDVTTTDKLLKRMNQYGIGLSDIFTCSRSRPSRGGLDRLPTLPSFSHSK